MGHKELNFTLGANFGQLIHSVLYENITVDMSPRKAYDLLDSCGLPATLFNEVIVAKKIIVADEGGQNFYLRDRSELTEEQLKDYRPKDGYSEWLSNKLDKTIEYMDELVHEIRKMYSGAEHISIDMSHARNST